MASDTSIILGRVQPHPAHWAAIQGAIGYAPEIATSPPPIRSPELWRYRNPRYRGQLIGCCVGESGSATAETACRTPDPLPPGEPQPIADAPSFSPLGVYWAARQYSAQAGRPVQGEGAIVSDALLAVQKWGIIPYDAWPATPTNYRAYSDRTPPTNAVNAFKGAVKPSGEARLLRSADEVLAWLGRGYSVWVGTPWRGDQQTAPDGAFNWGGQSIGGHAYELLGYDQSYNVNRLYIGNSWMNAGWGAKVNSVQQSWGYCPLSQWLSYATPAAFQTGEIEAVVIAEWGWRPTPSPVPPPPTPKPDPVPPSPPVPVDDTPTFVDVNGVKWQPRWVRVS